jgi:hypothetical protein
MSTFVQIGQTEGQEACSFTRAGLSLKWLKMVFILLLSIGV